MIPVEYGWVFMWNQSHWLAYQIIFPSIYGSSKTESVWALGVDFTRDCSWIPRWTRTWFGPSSWWLEPDKLRASFSIWTPMLISLVSIWFSKYGHMHGGPVLIKKNSALDPRIHIRMRAIVSSWWLTQAITMSNLTRWIVLTFYKWLFLAGPPSSIIPCSTPAVE